MTASIPSYLKYVNELSSKFPKETQKILKKYEESGEYDNPEYVQVVYKELYAKHICRLDPWPEPVERMFKHLALPVYNTMQGNNEFVVTGTFKDWDSWDRIKNITVPTLIIGAKYDSMKVAELQKMAKLIPTSRFANCENGSHLSLYDDQEAYFNHLIKFIKDVDDGYFQK